MMTSTIHESLAGRIGASFGFTLIPALLHHANPLHDKSAPPLPYPDRTGRLPTSMIDTLYGIALYPEEKWSICGHNSLDSTVFTNFINYKTDIKPSYFTAYLQSVELYEKLTKQLGSADKAMDYLYTPDPSAPPQNWNVVRNWAIKEYLLLFMISGNFRAYGWLNFPGWMGSGPFDDPNNLPYRGINYGG